jgi:hypothetical protein
VYSLKQGFVFIGGGSAEPVADTGKSTTMSDLRFQVYKRDRLGRVTRVGIVVADNKVQADTKAKMLYGKTLQYSNGEAVWTTELAA